jgi:hypothetical protein
MTLINPFAVITNWRFAALFFAVAVAGNPTSVLATNVETASLNVHDGVTTLSAESARPLATAIQLLVDRDGALITYEDPPYTFKDDLQDVTRDVAKGWAKYVPGTVIVPMGGKLAVNVASTDVALVLEQLVQTQSESGTGGRFRVEQTGDAFHVVPTQVRDHNGNWALSASILDIPISIPTQDRAAQEILDEICKAVSAAAHVRLWIGMGLGGGLMSTAGPPQYRLGADYEPARSVLMRALAAVAVDRGKLTWVLFYGDDSYALSIFGVPDRAVPPATAQPKQSTSPPKSDTSQYHGTGVR